MKNSAFDSDVTESFRIAGAADMADTPEPGLSARDVQPSAQGVRDMRPSASSAWDAQPSGLSAADDENLDVADRHALRRVPGLSTELRDVTEVEYRRLRLERVVLVGVWTHGTMRDAENSLVELKLLAETAGSQVLAGLLQRRDKPDPATYIGAGKAHELRDIVVASGADTVICDGELSPSQLRNLEQLVKVKVVDRTALILDIFAQHARSREGKAQVELAQMTYLLPRLRGWGESLSRQAGGRAGAGGVGIGGRGPGETKIELDRRRIRARMTKLRRELAELATTRDVKRRKRRVNDIPAVAIAGYTNAGKSSLLNRLTGAGVLVEDALFATLDPTVRRATTSDGRIYTLTDTVGFVRHLPHQLVEAFRSTLEEVTDADLVLHVVDGAHADPFGQIDAVRAVFDEIGASHIPELVAVNKTDIADPAVVAAVLRSEERKGNRAVAVSVRTGAGLDDLRRAIEEMLPRPAVHVDVLVPYDEGRWVARIYELGDVDAVEHTPAGTRVRARVPAALAAELAHLGSPSR
ncbi:MAG: GTPase HflX [Acidothermus cellulolyticus]|nr:GTPase HflX [Acidothermus cellulolyticus]